MNRASAILQWLKLGQTPPIRSSIRHSSTPFPLQTPSHPVAVITHPLTPKSNFLSEVLALTMLAPAMLILGCSDSESEPSSGAEILPNADSRLPAVPPSPTANRVTPVSIREKASPRAKPDGRAEGSEKDVVKTNYKHSMEIRIPKAIEDLGKERVEALRNMEATLQKARRRLADWEAKGHDAVPKDPVELQNLRSQIQQESQQESRIADSFVVRQNWEMRIRDLKRDIDSAVGIIKSNQEGRAKGYLGMKVKDYDLRFLEKAPALRASLEEEEKMLLTFHEGEAWQQGAAELKQIHERIDDLVSGRTMRQAEEAKMATAKEEAKKFPWKTPQEAAGHAFVGNELWNLDTRVRERSPIHSRGGVPHLIQNNSNLLAWLPEPGDRSGGVSCPDLTDAGPDKPETDSHYAIRETPGLPAMDQFRLSTGDWRRFLFMAEGDLWRGTVDWKTRKAVDFKRVTNTSQLSQARILHWHGRTVWLWTGLSTEKPVARIDLITGEITETPSWGVFSGREGETQISPSGSLLVRATEDRIVSLDLKSSRLSAIENRLENPAFGYPDEIKRHHRMQGRAVSAGVGRYQVGPGLPNFVWLPDERVIVAGSFGKTLILDPRAGTVAPVTYPPRSEKAGASPHEFGQDLVQQLPNGTHFVVRQHWSEDTPARMESREARFLLDITTGKSQPFPEGAEQLHPVNERLVLWQAKNLGLSGSGTWIWDITTGETSRLTPLFFSGSHRHTIWFPERNRLLFHAKGGEGARVDLRKLLVCDFQAGIRADIRELPVNGSSDTFRDGSLMRIATEEVDLGFSAGAPDPWIATAALPPIGDPVTQR